MNKHQRIRDPLHNLITFEQKSFDQTLWRIIQTPAFQRLRRIKQLGFSELVYPGATHTRFAHSLGVYHIANHLLEIIHQSSEGSYNEARALHARAAALLHDIGHGPFSHAFEDVGKRLNLKRIKHETVSDTIIRTGEIASLLNEECGSGFSDNVADLIASSGASHSIYGAVVSSQFDADRLDYMQRDRLMTGTQVSGGLDTPWLLSNLKVGEVDSSADDSKGTKRKTFVLSPKALYAAQTYIMGLFQLYPTVYYHKTTRGAEKLFTELMVRVFTLVRDGSLAATELPANHPLTLFVQQPENSEYFMALDDSVIMGILPLLSNAKDAITAKFAQRLLTRRLFKCIDVRESLRHTLCKNCEDNQERADEAEKRLTLALWNIQNRIAEWSAGQAFPRILSDSGVRVPYKRQGEEGSLLEQILIEDSKGRIVDIVTRSEIVRSIRPFQFYRIYVAPEDNEARHVVNDAIKEQENAHQE